MYAIKWIGASIYCTPLNIVRNRYMSYSEAFLSAWRRKRQFGRHSPLLTFSSEKSVLAAPAIGEKTPPRRAALVAGATAQSSEDLVCSAPATEDCGGCPAQKPERPRQNRQHDVADDQNNPYQADQHAKKEWPTETQQERSRDQMHCFRCHRWHPAHDVRRVGPSMIRWRTASIIAP